ncbi:MAG: glycosyltransferase family 4 protein [Flavobacteriales bacterium]|nr:glycosyltransferase family 4 protein [Flavobacteriales bacterium]
MIRLGEIEEKKAPLPLIVSIAESLNILHLSSPLSWRGGEQQLFYLFNGLKIKGIRQLVFCPENSILATKLADTDKILFEKKSGFDLNAAKMLKNMCAKNGVNLIHAHDSHSHTTAVLAALLFGNKPDIVLSRRVDFEIGKSWFSHYKYNFKKIKAIVCVSEAIRQIVLPKIKRTEMVKTVHSGVDSSKFFGVKKKNLKQELGIPTETKMVANVAALADHKDYPTFLRTAKNVLSKKQDVVFLIIGSGELEEELKEQAHNLKIANKVLFLGFRDDLPQLYPNFDLILFTSKTEGLGTSVLDAFANKIPVVATNAGGIPEMIINNETGLLAQIGDDLELSKLVIELLDNREKSMKLAENANQKLAEFSVENMVNKTYEIYQQIAAN